MTDRTAPEPLPLFAWTEAPTPTKFVRAPDDPRDYRAEWDRWREANPKPWAFIRAQAAAMLAAEVKRVSVNALFERVREVYAVSINHDWRAICADDLIAQEPKLGAMIERRRRTVTK